MGGGIAQVCARAGLDVVVLEADEGLLKRGLDNIAKDLEKVVARGKMTAEEKDEVLGRIRGTVNLRDFSDRDVVIEAIIENLEKKQNLFRELDIICPPQTLFCSNTSSIPIIEMASVTKRPGRCIGLHFFNPVPVMKLIEVIGTILTDDSAVQEGVEFSKAIGKTPIVTKDRAGFVVNLLLIPFIVDAIRALELGLASAEDIDTGMTLGCSHPMGPLALADFIGLDTVYYISNILYDEFKDPKYAAPLLLKQMVKAGYLGRKSGRGIYLYNT